MNKRRLIRLVIRHRIRLLPIEALSLGGPPLLKRLKGMGLVR